MYDPQDIQKKINEQCLQTEPVVRPLITVAEKISGASLLRFCDGGVRPFRGAGTFATGVRPPLSPG